MRYSFSSAQRDGLFSASNRFLDESLRGKFLLRDPHKRRVLNTLIADAIERECETCAAGFNPAMGTARAELAQRVYDDVWRENEKCGFVLTSFLLMMMCSWLIHSWLDFIFSNDAYPESGDA